MVKVSRNLCLISFGKKKNSIAKSSMLYNYPHKPMKCASLPNIIGVDPGVQSSHQ